MPGDPKECRQHARNCARLAQTASLPEAKEKFADLANIWLRLADGLEATEALFAAVIDEDIRKVG
jgi:hypothetical protein